jgi:hypothetical protein
MPKISQLNPISQLTTSSILPVVDNGATQNVTLKRVVEFVSASIDVTFATEIELLQSASSVTSSLNSFASASILSVATKLSTSSFEAYTASVQSTNTSSLLLTSSFNTFTSSYKADSASFDSRVDNLELISVTPFLSSSTFNTFTSSYTTHSSSFDSRLDIVEGINVTPFLSASTFNTYTSSNNTTNTTQNSRLSSLESNSGSYLLKSETGSFITEAETGSFLTSIPNGIISSSAQITNFGFATTSSVLNIDTSSLVTTSSFNTYTASISTASLVSRLHSIESVSGSWITESETGSFALSANLPIVTPFLSSSTFNTFTQSYQTDSSSFNTRINNVTGSIASGTVSSSIQITNLGFATTSSLAVVTPFLSSSVFNTFATSSNTFTASVNTTTASLNTFSSSINTFTSSYTTHSSSFDSRINSIVNGSGFATTSSFNSLTSSFTTYSGSINTYTSSMNSYTASINSTTASLNSKTGSYATTGSNQFKADQTITGSLTVTALTTISSSISANSSSLYLTSGSNLYVQNNGLVEITGSLIVSGSNNINLVVPVLIIGTGSGDEGGEINLAKAVTNTTLTGSGVTVDVYRDRVRIFEQGGDARGVYIDLAKTPAGVAGELLWKASGIVNAGTFVTLDNIKATVTTTSNRGLSLATVAGTVTGYISGHYVLLSGSPNGGVSTTSLSTTATSSMFSWNFTNQGDTSTYILRDDTNNRVYRITLLIGGSYNNNFISIERLF